MPPLSYRVDLVGLGNSGAGACPLPDCNCVGLSYSFRGLPLITVDTLFRQFHLFAPHARCRQLNSLVDLDITGAAAEVP